MRKGTDQQQKTHVSIAEERSAQRTLFRNTLSLAPAPKSMRKRSRNKYPWLTDPRIPSREPSDSRSELYSGTAPNMDKVPRINRRITAELPLPVLSICPIDIAKEADACYFRVEIILDMTDLVYSIADFLNWTFGILELSQNGPNYLFILLGFVGIVYWLFRQKRYSKEDKEAGRLI